MHLPSRLFGVGLVSAITASCGGIGGSGWQYKNTTDPVTKNSVHSASRVFDVNGSNSDETSIEASIECVKENDPYSLYVKFLSFDGDATKTESALELSSDINIRFNGAAIGPIQREGSEFSNEARYQLARLNFIPIAELYKETKGGANDPLGILGLSVRMFPNATASERLFFYDKTVSVANVPFFGGAVQESMRGFFELQRKVWATDFVFSAVTSVGNINIAFSLADPEVRKVVEACGFALTERPVINAQSQQARTSESMAGRGDDEYPPAVAAPEEPVAEEEAAPAEAAPAAPAEEDPVG